MSEPTSNIPQPKPLTTHVGFPQFGIADLLLVVLGTSVVAAWVRYQGFNSGIWYAPLVGVATMLSGLARSRPQQFSVGITLTAFPLAAVLVYALCRMEYPSSWFQWVFMAVLPAGPLLLIGTAASFCRSLRASSMIFGAFLGVLITSSAPFGMLLYEASHYRGGGANIGLGLLLLAGPVLVPIGITVGATFGIIGNKIYSRHAGSSRPIASSVNDSVA